MNPSAPTDTADTRRWPKWHLQAARFGALIPAAGVTMFAYGYLSGQWKNYWVGKDTQQTVAHVSKERGHGVVDYSYHVRQIGYSGSDQGNRATPVYVQPRPGDAVPVYYSASHPWLSNLTPPSDEHKAVGYGWPWFVGVAGMWLLTVSIVIRPHWFVALNERLKGSGGRF